MHPRRYDGIVKLHLVYYGPVLSSGNSGKIENKHVIRCALSDQIKSFVIKHLPDVQLPAGGLSKVSVGNHQFIPLVTRKLRLQCEYDGLLLMRQPPSGKQVDRGDSDGIKKTITDALRMPALGELTGLPVSPDPIFCLLENDDYSILGDGNHNVRRGTLLAPFEPTPVGVSVGEHRKDDSLLVITADIQPVELTKENMAFLTR
jgi:hypothetical protein